MPVLDMENTNIGNGFGFSAIRTDSLGATEYTLAVVASDRSGSVGGFNAELLTAIQNAVKACRKSPRSNNILVRGVRFNTGIDETFGFTPSSDLDPDAMPAYTTGGGTALYDAAFSSVGSVNAYANQLTAQDFLCNGIIIVITDGADNASRATPSMIKAEMEQAVKGEHLESMISILVGVNTSSSDAYPSGMDPSKTGRYLPLTEILQDTKTYCGFTHYMDIGDATPEALAKLGEFISHSISSTSQALGTGGPSQAIVI